MYITCIVSIVFTLQLESGFKEGLDNGLKKYETDTDIKTAFDDLQSQVKNQVNIHSTDINNTHKLTLYINFEFNLAQ